MATPVQDRQQVDCSISYDFNYVEPPPDRVVCKICRSPCREAQKSECCDHVFCKQDIDKMKAVTAVSHACPICRVEPFKTYPDRAVDREIKGLKIYCRNKEVGCGCSWSGELDQIDVHLNRCEIACKYCKEVMHYTAMISHINECPCYCQYCATVVEKDGQHMEKCGKFLIPCPNACGKDKIPRDEIDSHKDECRLEMVWCEYYDVGCKTTLVREEMPAHYRDAMREHLQYMHNVVRQLQKEKEKSKVVAEVSSLENAKQIKELLSNQTLHEEGKAKVREEINDLKEKYNNMSRNTVILVVVLVLVLFALLVNSYNNNEHFNLLQENTKLQNDKITKAVIEAGDNLETLMHYVISILHRFISGLTPFKHNLDILGELSGNVLLVSPLFKLREYQEMIKTKEDWTSSPFLAFDGGYQLCLKVYPAGIGEGAGSHVSVELYLMEGPHDDKLQRSGHWPMKGNFSIELLNPQHSMASNTISVYFITTTPISHPHRTFEITSSDIKETQTHRVTHSGVVKIKGIDRFVSHETLAEYSRSGYASPASGILYFRVQYNDSQITYREIYTLSEQLNTRKLFLQHALIPLHVSQSNKEVDDQVAPVTLPLLNFSAMVVGDDTWYSSPFFAFMGGYQVCLKAVRVQDCLVSSQLFLMKGPHDDKLQELGLWPMKGTFKVKLFGNNDYYQSIYTPPEERCTKCFEQVTTDDIASEGFGFSLVTLDSSCTKPDFFTDDALFFEVLYDKGTALYA